MTICFSIWFTKYIRNRLHRKILESNEFYVEKNAKKCNGFFEEKTDILLKKNWSFGSDFLWR